MEKLLSDKWDNAFLNEAVTEGLIYCRRERLNATKSVKEEVEFFRENSFFLVDHPVVQNLNSNVVVVEANNRNLVFMNKGGLVNELDKHQLPDSTDVIVKVSDYVQEVGTNVMNKTNVLNISSSEFTKLLKQANLDDVVEVLQLETPKEKSKMTI